QAFEPWPADWALALVNYRGYGAREGRPSERAGRAPARPGRALPPPRPPGPALCPDAPVMLDALAQRPEVDPTRIVLVGRSLGTGVATQVAAQRPVQGVVVVRQHGRGRSVPLPV